MEKPFRNFVDERMLDPQFAGAIRRFEVVAVVNKATLEKKYCPITGLGRFSRRAFKTRTRADAYTEALNKRLGY